jgi:uncharacterized protein (DUF305 family)
MMKYSNLFLMMVLSFMSMYILMYMMVDKFDNVYPSLNQFYMAGMMTAPMIIIELLLMGSMYPNKKTNVFIMVFSVVILFLFITLIRKQTFISDKEFIKSMIPHHAGAILMCEKSSIEDPKIKKLCQSIKSSQQSEIDWMKMKLNKLEKR